MAFSWVQDISIGGQIDAADLLEIRTNVDTVDDEKCTDHEVSYKLDHKDGDDVPHYTDYCSSQQGTYRSGHCPAYCSTYNSGVQTSYASAVYTTVLSPYA